MKKSELKKAVESMIEAGNTDRNAIAIELMQKGASLSMVNRELNAALKDNGIEVQTNTGSEELKKVREHIKEELNLESIETYRDLRLMAEEIEDNFAISFDAAVKAIKAQMKDDELEIPSKVKLGSQKEGILNYFLDHGTKATLNGLADYLHKNVTDDDDEPISKDKALHLARMNYTFASMIYNRQSLEMVN